MYDIVSTSKAVWKGRIPRRNPAMMNIDSIVISKWQAVVTSHWDLRGLPDGTVSMVASKLHGSV